MRRLTLASALAIVVAGCASVPAYADGCNPELQDCPIGPRAEAPAPRAKPAAYTYSVTASGGRRAEGSACGENISARRCAEIKRRFRQGLDAENARNGRISRGPRREARDEYRDERGRRVIDDTPRRRYRDEERGYRDSDYERERSARRRDERAECGREVEASGTQLPLASSARNSAITAWKRQVRFKYGERYAEWENARKTGPDGLDCVGSGTSASTFWKRCVATAVPCTRGNRD